MSALDTQVGGDHYKSATIQPVQYIEANSLAFLEGCIIKRVTRHNKPTGKGRQDIEKAIHELQLLLELRYGETVEDYVFEPINETEPAASFDHPAWPDDKAYRWMAQDLNGRWYAYTAEPTIRVHLWDCNVPGKSLRLTESPEWVIGDWRDTLIERGADE